MVLTLLLLSLTTVTAVYASRPESSSNQDEQIIPIVTYGSIIGETIINHHLYLGVDKNVVDTFEPLFAAFADRLYGLKTAFGKVTVRYEGTLDVVDTSDFTDMSMMWKGEQPLDFYFSAQRKIKHGGGFVTDIYLDITSEYSKPGYYSFTGKYRDVPYTLYIEVKPQRGGSIPADPADLAYLSVTFLPLGEIQERPVSDISLHFTGVHEWLTLDDLRDVQLTNSGIAQPFIVHDYIVRHYVFDGDGNIVETVFTLVFDEPLTKPGTYRISGYYRDEPFSLSWMQLN